MKYNLEVDISLMEFIPIQTEDTKIIVESIPKNKITHLLIRV